MQAAHARPMAAFWLLAAVAAAVSGLGMHDGPLSGPNLHATAPSGADLADDVATDGAQRGAKDEAQAMVPGALLLPVATGAPAPRVATVTQATPRVHEVAVPIAGMTVSAATSSTAKSTPRPRSRTKVSSTSTRDAATTATRPRHGRGHGGGAGATAASTQAPGHSGAAHGDHGVRRGH